MRAVLLGILLCLARPAGRGGPEAGLYLADLGARYAVVFGWGTESPPAPFLYGPRGSAPATAAVECRGPILVAALSDLVPDTVYEVSCGSRRTVFRTQKATLQTLRVAVVGHTGGTHPPLRHPPEELVSRIASLRPDMVVHAGDAVYHCSDQAVHEEFLRLFDPVMSTTPVYLAPGNHESGYPSATPDYAVFKRCLPYPLAAPAREAEAPPFYVIERGPARFIVLCYFKDQLLPGTAQRRWLDAELAKPGPAFTVLVFGMGSSTFTHRERILESLPANRIDLVVGGDGQGTSLKKEHGMHLLFNGSGGSGPHPYSLLEIGLHELRVQTFDLTGHRLHGAVLQSRAVPTPLADMMPSFRHPMLLDGGTLEPGGEALTLKGLGEKALVWGVNVPPLPDGRRSRGMRVLIALAGRRPDAATCVFLVWHPKEHGDAAVLYRSQPWEVRLDGKPHALILDIPDHDPLTGLPVTPGQVGVTIEQPPPELESVAIHDAYLF